MSDLYAEALSTFARLFEEAKQSREVEPNAMTVATADAQGRPSARTVLLKAFDERGFVFYTHLDSHKGRELRSNPQAALLFLWRSLREAGIQVRIEGRVEQVADAEADAYFASRPRMSQIGAWASQQSKTLATREEFDARVAEVEARFEGRTCRARKAGAACAWCPTASSSGTARSSACTSAGAMKAVRKGAGASACCTRDRQRGHDPPGQGGRCGRVGAAASGPVARCR